MTDLNSEIAPGLGYRLISSHGISNWRPIGTANNDKGQLSFIDPTPSTTQLKFYHAIQSD